MADYNLMTIFLTFIFYSFAGWILEIIVCSIDYKKLVNRGFLFGPWCPIYGVGALFILWTLLRYEEDPIVVFVFGVLITSVIEYYTSYVLEKIFHNKWWDYSHRRDSINGRICIGNMLGFGIGACAIIYAIQPVFLDVLSIVNVKVLKIVSISLAVIFIVDEIYSCFIAYALRNRIIIAEELKAEKLKMLPSMLEKKFKNRINSLHIITVRYFKVFPDLKKNYEKELDQIKKWVEKSKRKKK